MTFVTKKAPGYDYVGEFVAFIRRRAERKWAYKAPSGAAMTAAALATAGGVVFGGTADRQFFALNTETGELLWQTRLNGDVSGARSRSRSGAGSTSPITAGGRAGPTTSFGPLTNSFLPAGSGSVYVFALPPAREPPNQHARPDAPGPDLAVGRSRRGQEPDGIHLRLDRPVRADPGGRRGRGGGRGWGKAGAAGGAAPAAARRHR